MKFKNKIAEYTEYTIASHSQYIVNINTTFDQNLLYAINWLRIRYNHFNTFSKKSGVKKECPHIFDAIKYLLLENYDIDGRTLDSYFGGYAPEYIKEIEEKDIEKMLEMSYALFIPIIPNDSNDKIKKGYPLSVTFYCKGQNFGTYIYNSIKEFCQLYLIPVNNIRCGTVLYQSNALYSSFQNSQLDAETFMKVKSIKNFYVINNIDKNVRGKLKES